MKSIFLQACNLMYGYEDEPLFKDLNFTLNTGELLELVGANGAGKTSLLQLLAGLRLPEQGSVIWSGHDITELGPEYYQDLLYLGYQHGMKASLTPRENLHFTSALRGLPTLTSIDNALAYLQLTAVADLMTHNLSSGQQRRIASARLLLEPAELWILDEPFTALDQAGIKLITQLLSDHIYNGGMAIFSSHQPIDLPNIQLQKIYL